MNARAFRAWLSLVQTSDVVNSKSKYFNGCEAIQKSKAVANRNKHRREKRRKTFYKTRRWN
jgi:hypothetical protein